MSAAPTQGLMPIWKIAIIDGRPEFYVEAEDQAAAIAKAKDIALIFGNDDGIGFATTEHDPDGSIRQKQLGADRIMPNLGPVTATVVPGATILVTGPDGEAKPQETALAIRQEAYALAKKEIAVKLDGVKDTLVSSFKKLEAGIGDAPVIPDADMWDHFIEEADAKLTAGGKGGLPADFTIGKLGQWFREYRGWLVKMKGNLRAVQARIGGA